MKKYIIYFWVSFLFLIGSFFIIWALSNFKIHDFAGKCSICHANIPAKDDKVQDMIFVNEIDLLCAQCHTISRQMSHPIKIKPKKDIPLAAHLDKNGQITCSTCHDVHKEDKVSSKFELEGLLWGHTKGKSFCFLCHNQETLGAEWRHQTAIPYAHPLGKLVENAGGFHSDKFYFFLLKKWGKKTHRITATTDAGNQIIR